MTFESDIRGQISDWLATNGYSTKGDLRTLVIRYQNITRRIPPRMEWHLQLSNGLVEKALPKGIQEGLDYFMEQAKSGADLRPFLSALLRHGDYADLLLSDWGIYHFHLGTKLAKIGSRKGFVKGTDELLFAIADPENAAMYLIDIHPHESGFTNQDLLRVLEENWPELLDRHALQRVTPSYKDLSDEEVELLRSGRINVAYGTPGGRTVAMMGGGITTAKTNAQDVRKADYLVWRVRQAEEALDANMASIERYFMREHRISKKDLSFQAQLGAEDTIWVSEVQTDTPVWNDRVGWLIQTIEVDL